MMEYFTQYGINIITTSPTSSQGNGLAGMSVTGKRVQFECRNKPISSFPFSPNQMLFSRQIRTRVPTHPLVPLSLSTKDL